MKSEVAATRLRYEQQVKNLSTELTSMHVSLADIFLLSPFAKEFFHPIPLKDTGNF